MKPLLAFACIVSALAVAPAQAENLNFRFNNPSFGGNPNNGSWLFGLAEAQRTATIDPDELDGGGGGGAQIPGIGGGGVGGPTIVIPINSGVPDAPDVGDATGGDGS